jgi:hypothetical protein
LITAKTKNFFFDRAAVRSMMDAKTAKALSRAGAFIRQRARTSIRSRKKISEPGQPPSSHVGELKRRIWFAYEPATQSVVIGPMRFKQGEAPGLLEFGGQATRQRRNGEKYVATYRPRPYMGPAMEKELPNLPSHWAKSVKGGV